MLGHVGRIASAAIAIALASCLAAAAQPAEAARSVVAPPATITSSGAPLSAATAPVAATPTPWHPMSIRVEAGPATGFRFDAAGRILATRTATLSRPSSALASDRRTIPGHGVYLAVSNGLWAGYWIRESTVAYLPGIAGDQSFPGPRAVSFQTGTYLGYRFDSGWRLAATKTARLSRTSVAHAGRSAVINGRVYVAVIDGIWAGYWMPGTTSRPDGLACTAGDRVAAGSMQVITRGPATRSQLALTFDVGGRLDPAKSILERLILDRVCATVFPTGAVAESSQGRALLAIVRAHPELFEVGNHTQHHCDLAGGGGGIACPATPPSAAFIGSELTQAASAISSAAGRAPAPYWRPPYGAWNTAVVRAAAAVGYTKAVMWSTDTIDWRPVGDGGPTAAQIAAKVRANTGAGSIVLMHLGGYNTYDALPSMLAGLRARGLTPTSISDLLQ